MAATACAYAFEGGRRPSPSPQVPESPFDLDSRAAVKSASSSPVPPPPPLLRPSSFFSRHPGLCTEGLGSESSGDVDLDDDAINDDVDNKDGVQIQARDQGPSCEGQQREPARTCGKPFPPPISVIGAGGKPWLYLRPHRADGRLVLREVRIPSQELLQARREDGRFKLHFAAPQPEEDDEEDHNA